MLLALACLCFLLICSIVTIRKVKASEVISGRHHYKKTVATALLLLGAFGICWIPLIIFEIVMYILFRSAFAYSIVLDFEKFGFSNEFHF